MSEHEKPKAAPHEAAPADPQQARTKLIELRKGIGEARKLDHGKDVRTERIRALTTIKNDLGALKQGVENAKQQHAEPAQIPAEVQIVAKDIDDTIKDVDVHIEEAGSKWHAFLEKWYLDKPWDWLKQGGNFLAEASKPLVRILPLAPLLNALGFTDAAKAIEAFSKAVPAQPAAAPKTAEQIKAEQEQANVSGQLAARVEKTKTYVEAAGLTLEMGKDARAWKQMMLDLDASHALYQQKTKTKTDVDAYLLTVTEAHVAAHGAKATWEQFKVTMKDVNAKAKPSSAPAA